MWRWIKPTFARWSLADWWYCVYPPSLLLLLWIFPFVNWVCDFRLSVELWNDWRLSTTFMLLVGSHHIGLLYVLIRIWRYAVPVRHRIAITLCLALLWSFAQPAWRLVLVPVEHDRELLSASLQTYVRTTLKIFVVYLYVSLPIVAAMFCSAIWREARQRAI